MNLFRCRLLRHCVLSRTDRPVRRNLAGQWLLSLSFLLN